MANQKSSRAGVSLPAKPISAWDVIMRELQPMVAERPEGSVTAEELAAKIGSTTGHAANLLRSNVNLRAVKYRTESGRRALCYVVKQ